MSTLEELHVEVRGGPGAPLLVFVPGWGCDRTVWCRVTPFLDGAFRVAVFDPRGLGESEGILDGQTGWSLSATSEDIRSVLVALGAARAVVVGSSLGGLAALRLASAPPPGLAGIVAIGASPCPIRRPDFSYGPPAEMMAEVMSGLRHDFLGTCQALAPGLYFSGKSEKDMQAEKALLLGMLRRIRKPNLYVDILERSLASDIRPLLEGISLPILLLHGSEDASAPPDVGEFTKSRVRGSRLVVIPGTGHLPHLTAPKEVADEIARFATGLSPASGNF